LKSLDRVFVAGVIAAVVGDAASDTDTDPSAEVLMCEE